MDLSHGFADSIKAAATVRSYPSAVAVILIGLILFCICTLYAPINEYVKYIIIFVMIILGYFIWKPFHKWMEKYPPPELQDYLIHLAGRGFGYGKDGEMIDLSQIGHQRTTNTAKQLKESQSTEQETEE